MAKTLKMAVGYKSSEMTRGDIQNLIDVLRNMPMPCMITDKILAFAYGVVGIERIATDDYEADYRAQTYRIVHMLEQMIR